MLTSKSPIGRLILNMAKKFIKHSVLYAMDQMAKDLGNLANSFDPNMVARGMNRVITAAEFIKGNMPFGTTFENVVLTDEEAYDDSGYINSMNRPNMANREKYFPDLLKKPISTPYGPYADSFSMEQHKYGPFQPIMEYYKKEHNINKTK